MHYDFSISTVAYSGYNLEQALDSMAIMGVHNIELALIQGAVYDLQESDLTLEFAKHAKNLLSNRQMSCTSLAAHCELNLENCEERLLRRIHLCVVLSCPRLILYAPREASLYQFQTAAKQAIGLARLSGIKILIENVGDTQPYVLNDADDGASILQELHEHGMGINFDPGNFLSHRPHLDVLEHSIKSLDFAEHIHLKDLACDNEVWRCCELGEGSGKYKALLQYAKQQQRMPFFSIESPYALERLSCGSIRLKPKADLFSIKEIEARLSKSVSFIKQQLA
ncbi:TIM barrel protein [Vibrio sp. FNV 38]|nr:TIM barrel protein [Vibrio sp. FNV 38]